ncbi:MAG: hypothetical protein QM817_10260 [Archangium sp.]
MPKRTPDTEHHEVITVKNEVRELPVVLSPEELADRAQQLADCHTQLEEHNERSKALRKELSKEKQVIVARRAMLSGVVKRKQETRDVRVAIQTDMTERKYLEVREDSGEIIAERPLRPEEMQRKLGLVVPMTAEKKPEKPN